MTEQWSRWNPIEGLTKHYSLDSISDAMEEFKIVLSDTYDKNKKLSIRFENSVESYKCTNETYKIELFGDHRVTYGVKFYSSWTFFKVDNSSYVQLMLEESREPSDKLLLQHFCIFTTDVIIDIIASYEPKIEWIETNQTPHTEGDKVS